MTEAPRITEVTPPRAAAISTRIAAQRDIYLVTYNDSRAAGLSEFKAEEAAALAWGLALPSLSTRSQVQAFIACVVAGFAAKFIGAGDTKTLLYGAQMALATLAPSTPTGGEK